MTIYPWRVRTYYADGDVREHRCATAKIAHEDVNRPKAKPVAACLMWREMWRDDANANEENRNAR